MQRLSQYHHLSAWELGSSLSPFPRWIKNRREKQQKAKHQSSLRIQVTGIGLASLALLLSTSNPMKATAPAFFCRAHAVGIGCVCSSRPSTWQLGGELHVKRRGCSPVKIHAGVTLTYQALFEGVALGEGTTSSHLETEETIHRIAGRFPTLERGSAVFRRSPVM